MIWYHFSISCADVPVVQEAITLAQRRCNSGEQKNIKYVEDKISYIVIYQHIVKPFFVMHKHQVVY